MPMMLFMTWMEKICKVVVCELNLLVIHVIEEMIIEEVETEDDLVAEVEVGMMTDDLVEILQAQEPTTDWLWRISHLELLGRYVFLIMTLSQNLVG